MTFGAQEAAAAGFKITVRPYPAGESGIRLSIEEVCRLMREARLDPDIKGWTVRALTAKGLDGRKNPSIKAQAQALLDTFRAQTIYVPDATGAEHIQAAHVTLCLRDRCMPGEDCESLVVALGGAMLSIGLPVYGVKVVYGEGYQQHILLGLIDESDHKIYADPSTNRPVMTSVPNAVEEVWIDPMDQVGHVGTAGPEIVTLGASGKRMLFNKGGYWFEYAGGRWWVYVNGQWVQGLPDKRAPGLPGMGAPFQRGGSWWARHSDGAEVQFSGDQARAMGLGAADVTSTTPYQQVTGGTVHAGFRYRVGMMLTFATDPTTMDQSEITGPFAADWFVESFESQGAAQFVPGTNDYIQSFILQGIAKRDMTLTDGPTVKYLVVGVQTATISPVATGALLPDPPVPPASSSNVSIVTVGTAAAVLGGVGYFFWKRRQSHRG